MLQRHIHWRAKKHDMWYREICKLKCLHVHVYTCNCTEMLSPSFSHFLYRPPSLSLPPSPPSPPSKVTEAFCELLGQAPLLPQQLQPCSAQHQCPPGHLSQLSAPLLPRHSAGENGAADHAMVRGRASSGEGWSLQW